MVVQISRCSLLVASIPTCLFPRPHSSSYRKKHTHTHTHTNTHARTHTHTVRLSLRNSVHSCVLHSGSVVVYCERMKGEEEEHVGEYGWQVSTRSLEHGEYMSVFVRSIPSCFMAFLPPSQTQMAVSPLVFHLPSSHTVLP